MTNNVGLAFNVVTLYYNLQFVLSKTIRIGDTKYHIYCTFDIWVKNATLSFKKIATCNSKWKLILIV